jgi:pyruvate,water dikinase
MIASEVSGVCFSVHPVTKDKNQMVIEACLGLGEALVSGQITPDTYVVHKKDYSLLEVNVSEQEFAIVRGMTGNVRKKLSQKVGSAQKLSEKQIQKLAQLCKKVEQHYHHPQDIEWAYAEGKWHILQSRPITTL